jgi:hypothetical protein
LGELCDAHELILPPTTDTKTTEQNTKPQKIVKAINTVKIRKIAEVGKFFRKLARGNCGDL